MGSVEEGFDLVVDLLAEPGHLALGDAAHAHRLDEVIDGSGRNALNISLLDHSSQGLLGHAARLQKAREIAACAKLGNAKLDRAGPRLPVPVAIAVALGQSKAILLAIARAGLRADLQRHQFLGSKADHLA
jgi:hypothetical protein